MCCRVSVTPVLYILLTSSCGFYLALKMAKGCSVYCLKQHTYHAQCVLPLREFLRFACLLSYPVSNEKTDNNFMSVSSAEKGL